MAGGGVAEAAARYRSGRTTGAGADGLDAVLVVRHERKGGGDVGDSARGSSAFTGAVDVVLRLARQPNPVRPTIRELSAISRFDETPSELVIELKDDGYVVLGDQTAVAFDEATRGVLDVLPESPADGLNETQIIALVDGRKATVGTALRALHASGAVIRGGGGKKGDPFTYSRVSADPGFVSPVPPNGEDGGRKQFPPVSVSDRMAEIFDADDPPDVDEDEPSAADMAALAELFTSDGGSSWPN